MKISCFKDFKTVVNAWKRNNSNGQVTEQDIAIVWVWNDMSDEVLADVLAYYKFEFNEPDANTWKNKVLFG